jgi:TolB-like protein
MLKSNKLMKKRGLLTAVLFILTVLIANAGICAPPKRVAVFPFAMNSPQDLGFLQNGLFSMLSSRLSDPGKVMVVDRETVDKFWVQARESGATAVLNEAKARIIGADMGVDFILFGSLTHFGESVSLDASMVDVAGEKPTLSFFEQSNTMGDVIPLVNSFAGDINQKVFNRSIANELYAKQVPQAPGAPGGLQHAGGGAGYGGGVTAIHQGGGQGFMTHLSFAGVITAMDAGDLNQDGQIQVVTATDSNLFIHNMKGTALVQTEKLEFSSNNRIVALDIADINKNGYPEIFVTSLTIFRDGLQSFVVEYNGTSYVTIAENESCFYRVLKGSGSDVLMRQDKGRSPFQGRIHTMMPSGAGYTQEKSIRMPRSTSVLSLARGAVTAEGSSEYIMINEHNRLVLANDSGSMDWESTEKYGKTGNYWLMPLNDTDASYQERIYLNPRIKFKDIGLDGKQEVFVVRNNEIGGGAFGRYKRFRDGRIEMLAWNGIAMMPVFQTSMVQGWISDFALADMDGDGTEELVVSLVSRGKKSIISKAPASSVISYKLE